MKLQVAGLIIGAIAVTLGCASSAHAENYGSEFDRLFSESSGDLFYNASVVRQFQSLVGLSFRDSEFRKDNVNLHAAYKEGMRRQVGVPLSTVDLANPFNTSLRTNPSLTGGR